MVCIGDRLNIIRGQICDCIRSMNSQINDLDILKMLLKVITTEIFAKAQGNGVGTGSAVDV